MSDVLSIPDFEKLVQEAISLCPLLKQMLSLNDDQKSLVIFGGFLRQIAETRASQSIVEYLCGKGDVDLRCKKGQDCFSSLLILMSHGARVVFLDSYVSPKSEEMSVTVKSLSNTILKNGLYRCFVPKTSWFPWLDDANNDCFVVVDIVVAPSELEMPAKDFTINQLSYPLKTCIDGESTRETEIALVDIADRRLSFVSPRIHRKHLLRAVPHLKNGYQFRGNVQFLSILADYGLGDHFETPTLSILEEHYKNVIVNSAARPFNYLRIRCPRKKRISKEDIFAVFGSHILMESMPANFLKNIGDTVYVPLSLTITIFGKPLEPTFLVLGLFCFHSSTTNLVKQNDIHYIFGSNSASGKFIDILTYREDSVFGLFKPPFNFEITKPNDSVKLPKESLQKSVTIEGQFECSHYMEFVWHYVRNTYKDAHVLF